MLSRFLLIFAIAKFLPESDMGLYGLLTTTVIFSLYAVGLDFYVHSTRELIRTDKNLWGRIFKAQVKLSSVMYLIYLPCILVVFKYGALPWYIFPYFISILLLEHFCQELQRILIAAQKTLHANVGLFCRTGVWPLIIIPLLYYPIVERELISVLIAWIIGDLLAVIYFCMILRNMKINGWQGATDWKWVINGVKISSFFLIGTLALRFGSVAERYWLQNISTLEIVGVYSFFVGLSSVLSSFIDAGVIAFKYPKLIKAYSDEDMISYQKERKEMAVQVMAWVALLSFLCVVLIGHVLDFFGKKIYFQYESMFYLTLGAAIISCLALIPHYELYARGKDKVIVSSHILSLVVFFVIGLTAGSYNKIYAIPVATLCAQLFILLYKQILLVRIIKYERINLS